MITEASDYAIGTILSQETLVQDRPIAYANRIMSRAKSNYNTTKKELLAIVLAVYDSIIDRNCMVQNLKY